MTYDKTLTNCGDCGVEPGQPHVDGCDVARCTECGWQRISCEQEDADEGWGAIWTGEWPGYQECRDLGLLCKEGDYGTAHEGDPDLNRLDSWCRFGRLHWSKVEQRWFA